MNRKKRKRDLANQLGRRHGIDAEKALAILQDALDMIIDCTVKQGRLELRNFGVFEVVKQKARKARNLQSGESIELPERPALKFKPGKHVVKYVEEMDDKEAKMRFTDFISSATVMDATANDSVDEATASDGSAGNKEQSPELGDVIPENEQCTHDRDEVPD